MYMYSPFFYVSGNKKQLTGTLGRYGKSVSINFLSSATYSEKAILPIYHRAFRALVPTSFRLLAQRVFG